ncbi:InlB B-repeat-containing protein [Paenibacillus methanolicus]|uniref:Putative repeat protein (TIGR02543 family) n=1 Tax=Paenibacillus methanolicus TaxID=582686 RepID=A0A5S5CJQ6_9BACL|nr:InlB B-repeat-containing protein [Paenibacillus methanolicus]TYP78233.1 putative repeat protein (TIGR02543 family) [Paenibacillus methanolicus]
MNKRGFMARWVAFALAIIMMTSLAGPYAYAAETALLDQKQETTTGGYIWMNTHAVKYQTFTPGISGTFDHVQLHMATKSGNPGAIIVKLYKESSLSTVLAEGRSTAATSTGWNTVDFSDTAPYLDKGVEYRLAVSTEFGSSTDSSVGFSWSIATGNAYPGGKGQGATFDFAFRTYMMPDYSASPTKSKLRLAKSSLNANGVDQTDIMLTVYDAQGTLMSTGGAAIAITSTMGTVGAITDHLDGTYSATITAPTSAGTGVINATVDGKLLTDKPNIAFTPVPTYNLVYDGNGSTGGAAPLDAVGYGAGDTVIVVGNSGGMTKDGYEFAGWNTAVDGTGTNYASGSTFAMAEAGMTLYARWIADPSGVWKSLGPGEISPAKTFFSSVVVEDGTPYFAFQDYEHNGKATVKKYVDGHWVTVGSPGFSPDKATYMKIAVDGGTPYVGFSDPSNEGKETVMRFNGTAWEMVGAPGFSAGMATYNSIVVDDDIPYVAYSQLGTGKLAVKRFFAGEWQALGPPEGITPGYAFQASLHVDNGVPYVAYEDGSYLDDKIVVRKFNVDSGNWEHVGAPVPAAGRGSYPSLYVENGTPYVSYVQPDNKYLLAVMKFNGNEWESVGDLSFIGGASGSSSLRVVQGIPVLIYQGTGAKASVVRYVDGQWEMVGSGGFSKGAAAYLTGDVEGDRIYAAYADRANGDLPVVMRYTIPPTTYTIDALSDLTMRELKGSYGSGAQETKSVTLTRTGTGILANLGVSLSGANADAFTITQPAASTLNEATPSTAFTVRANDALSPGTYEAIATVRADQMTDVAFRVRQVVSEPTYAVHYNGNGHTGGTLPTDDSAYEQGATVIVAGNSGELARTGHGFAGWNTAADGTGTAYAPGQSFAMGAANVTLYAQWTLDVYTINFETNGGSQMSSQTVNYGELATAPQTPTKAGHTFGGWYADSELTMHFAFTTAITSDTTLYAKWTVNAYTVSFESDGGSQMGSQTVNYGELAKAPQTPTKAGHAFGGWYADSEWTTPFAFTTEITSDTTLYAKWVVNQHTVSFETSGGTAVNSQTVNYGSVSMEPQAPTKTGYAFDGWFANSELTAPFAFTTAITSDTTLYAKWTVNAYALSFESNGGTALNGQTVNYGELATAPQTPTKAGHTFGGWYVDSELTTPFAFTTEITGETTLYAKWTVNKQIVSFETNGGSSVGSQTVNYGDLAKEPTAPTKAGHKFDGWYMNGELTTTFAFTTAITGDTTLYAKWTQENTSTGGGSSTATATSPPQTVSSTNGQLKLLVGQAGEVSLGSEVKLTVPAGASSMELAITIEKVTGTDELVGDDASLASPIFEMLKNDPNLFRKPVTISLIFDPSRIPSGQQAGVYYYDEVVKVWVKVEGGQVDGNRITVSVDHFTKFAVFADGQAETETPGRVVRDIGGHWAEASIRQALAGGIVSGYEDGTFKPNATVTRAEFAVMLVKALQPQAEEAQLAFTDVGQIGVWAKAAVARAVKAGILSGLPDGTFRPNAAISRAEMAVMVARALDLTLETGTAAGFADERSIPAWAKGAAAALKQLGLMQGGPAGAFAPLGESTRAEAITVLLKAMAYKNG